MAVATNYVYPGEMPHALAVVVLFLALLVSPVWSMISGMLGRRWLGVAVGPGFQILVGVISVVLKPEHDDMSGIGFFVGIFMALICSALLGAGASWRQWKLGKPPT